jgi:methionyl-tRNA formyltransferase
MEQKLRVVFMGTPAFGIPSLDWLVRHTEVLGIVTQPDKPSGRGLKLTFPAIKQRALDLGINPSAIYQWESLSQTEAPDNPASLLKSLRADFFVVIAYGKILRAELLAVPRFGCVNVHASLLPKHRGASPLQSALLAGDSETGVCTMQMVAKMDAGRVYKVAKTSITPQDTLSVLHDRLSAMSPGLLGPTLDGLSRGELPGTLQEESEATYCKKIERSDGFLSWKQPAHVLERKVRALNPWPGTFLWVAHHRILVKSAQCNRPVSQAGSEAVCRPGLLFVQDGCIGYQTTQEVLWLEVLHFEGQKPLSAQAFCASVQASGKSVIFEVLAQESHP